MRIAVFPGTFDPFTLGHLDLVERASGLFDQLIIAIGENAAKQHMWTLAERVERIENAVSGLQNVSVDTYSGLTARYCESKGAAFILRGLRNTTDFNYEQTIAQANLDVNGVETIFLMTAPKYGHISSSIVRDLARNDGDYSKLIP